MLSVITCHAPLGIEGVLISVEVDLRRGFPGVDIVGLPDGAVRESRERVRVAIRNSGFQFPTERILVNLAPAGIRKEGASYDLPIALGILASSGQVSLPAGRTLMVLGELNLAGGVRPVHGVLSAVGAGLKQGRELFLVPQENLREARALRRGWIRGILSLRQAAELLERIGADGGPLPLPGVEAAEGGEAAETGEAPPLLGDFRDIRGQVLLRRALEIAAAGGHHLLIFGPPGSGKTFAVRRLPSILPSLSWEESLEATRIHSLAGTLPAGLDLIRRPPFRAPHHSASNEGIIGGCRNPVPGEASLAHKGILFLDEAAEFRASLLQSLREPLEEGRVRIARAGAVVELPAEFQLILTANPCPCGNLGRDSGVCLCRPQEIYGYWKRIGGAVLDRIDIRVPVSPVPAEEMVGRKGEGSAEVASRVAQAVDRQRERFRNRPFARNARIPAGELEAFCPLDQENRSLLAAAARKLSLSSRAFHSVVKLARTIADLAGSEEIRREYLLEAVQHRRYGDADLYWSHR